MRVPIWVHQVDTSYLQSALGADDEPLPFSEIFQKTHDGLTFMARFDAHPRAIAGLDDVAAMAREHAAAGRNWRPWCVVSGLDPEAEGQLAAAVALGAAQTNLSRDAVMIVDLEPYYHGGSAPQFWRSDRFRDGDARARRFLAAFAREGGQQVWLAIDAREPHLDPVSLNTWLQDPSVTLVMAQTYYTDFIGGSVSARDACVYISRAHDTLAARGVAAGRIGQILPGDSDPAVLIEAIRWCQQLGELAPSIWQRKSLSPAGAEALAAMASPWDAQPEQPGLLEQPEQPDSTTIALTAINEAQGALARARAALERRE